MVELTLSFICVIGGSILFAELVNQFLFEEFVIQFYFGIGDSILFAELVM